MTELAEIEYWRSPTRAKAWIYYFEKTKMFNNSWKTKQADMYISLRCHRSKDCVSEGTFDGLSYTCPFQIQVGGKLENNPVYTFEGKHDHPCTSDKYYRERFKAALYYAHELDMAPTFEELYKMVLQETGIDEELLESPEDMEKALIRRKTPKCRTTNLSPVPNIPPRGQSRIVRFPDSDEEEESVESDEDVMEDEAVQQPLGPDVHDGMRDASEQERESAGGEQVTQEEGDNVQRGPVLDDIAAPKVAHIEETRTAAKVRPVCRVAPRVLPAKRTVPGPTAPAAVPAVPIAGPLVIVLADDDDDDEEDVVIITANP